MYIGHSTVPKESWNSDEEIGIYVKNIAYVML